MGRYVGIFLVSWKGLGHTFQKTFAIPWSTDALWWSRETDTVENWKCDQATNLLTGVGSRDAYASKNIAGRYSCWILPHFSTRHAGRDKLDAKTKIQKDDNFYSFSGFSLKSILSEQFFQVWSAQPSSRLVGSASDRFQSTHRPFSNHMPGWESKHHKARFEEACP